MAFLGTLSTTVLGLSGWPVYAIAAGLAFAEAALFVGLVLPGETALVLGGVLAARHQVGLVTLLVAAIVAAVAGDSVGYLVGRRFGPGLRRTRVGRRISDPHWERAERFVARRGVWAVLAGRWVGVLRALVPTAAGMTRMPYRPFVIANAIGGALWAVVVVLLGYTAGASFAHVQGVLGWISGAVATVVVAALAGAHLAARRRDRAGALDGRPLRRGPRLRRDGGGERQSEGEPGTAPR
jgi:membrane-associated protein